MNDVELPGPPSQPSHAAPAVTDLLAGQVQVLFTGAPALLPHIRAGKMRTLASPELRTHFASEGAEPAPATPQAFGRLIASELARWRKVVKGAQIKAE